jgi:hypothetical protein
MFTLAILHESCSHNTLTISEEPLGVWWLRYRIQRGLFKAIQLEDLDLKWSEGHLGTYLAKQASKTTTTEVTSRPVKRTRDRVKLPKRPKYFDECLGPNGLVTSLDSKASVSLTALSLFVAEYPNRDKPWRVAKPRSVPTKPRLWCEIENTGNRIMLKSHTYKRTAERDTTTWWGTNSAEAMDGFFFWSKTQIFGFYASNSKHPLDSRTLVISSIATDAVTLGEKK